jgi:hypothetical protein
MYKKTINNIPRTSHNPFQQKGIDSTYTVQESTLEAVVVDVVVNDTHPQYAKDGYNIGAIKFRSLKTHMFRDDGDLNWALPLETNITEYPLLNEIVHIVPSLNRFYYSRKLNVSGRVTHSSMPGLNEELAPLKSSKEVIATFQKTIGTPVKVAGPTEKLGKVFRDSPNVYRLRHDEGDISWQGRSGQSIRFGASWRSGTNFQSTNKEQSPNILIRVGPGDATPSVSGPFGLVTEDINTDASSIYLVTDQIVDLTPATEGNTSHLASIPDFPKRLDGNQIIINTDRFVVNTKTDRIIGFAKKGIHWTSGQDATIDTERDYLSTIQGKMVLDIGAHFQSTATERHSIISPKVYIGMESDESQPVPLGALLAEFLGAFIDAHLQNASTHVITSMGPGTLSPSVIAALQKLKTDVARGTLASFNSHVAFTTKNG